MRNILLISHRFPYPPDRGEKIRIWYFLEHLARTHRVFLGCLSDDARDLQYLPQMEAICAGVGCFRIDRRWQKLRALTRIRPGRSLMLDYYGNAPLRRWVDATVARETIDLVYTVSTAMVPYALRTGLPAQAHLLDMVDIDSEKWAEYAHRTRGLARLVWAREARTLHAYERHAVAATARTLLVTEAERRRFIEMVPESSERVLTLENGVDLGTFTRPEPAGPSPYPDEGPWLTLVGNMDYWPNADAAIWFAREILPTLRQRAVPPKLAVVGSRPGPDVLALAELPGVLVTGRVPDVRPYLTHAAVALAPLRIARGVQNKVLEAMAMASPLVASPQAFEGIRATPGRDLLVVDGAEAMGQAVAAVLDGRHPGLGQAGRRIVEESYSWPSQFRRLDALIDAMGAGASLHKAG